MVSSDLVKDHFNKIEDLTENHQIKEKLMFKIPQNLEKWEVW